MGWYSCNYLRLDTLLLLKWWFVLLELFCFASFGFKVFPEKCARIPACKYYNDKVLELPCKFPYSRIFSDSIDINIFSQLGPFELFAFGPTLKFSLAWEGKPLHHGSSSMALREGKLDSISNLELAMSTDETDRERKQMRIFYQFIYSNHTRQQTEARDDFLCPWCSVNCGRLYSLLKHLKCCHGRFLFTYAVSTTWLYFLPCTFVWLSTSWVASVRVFGLAMWVLLCSLTEKTIDFYINELW